MRQCAGKSVEQRDVSVAFYSEFLSKAQMLDFSDPWFASASGQGRVRIRTAIALAARLEERAKIKADDLGMYDKLLKTEGP
jgi:hypothetical protein